MILNKFIYTGTGILDLNKVLMQDFHYNYIKNKYCGKAEMLTDTDSLMCKIKIENVYQELYKDKELFDVSNYPKHSKYYNNLKKLVIEKDEQCGVSILGFVGLKSKIQTFITEDYHECKVAKDINKNIVDDELKYEDYKNGLNKEYVKILLLIITIKEKIINHLINR